MITGYQSLTQLDLHLNEISVERLFLFVNLRSKNLSSVELTKESVILKAYFKDIQQLNFLLQKITLWAKIWSNRIE